MLRNVTASGYAGLCLSVFMLMHVFGGVYGAEQSAAGEVQKYAPVRDYSAENTRMVFGGKKKAEAGSGQATAADKKKDAADAYKKMKSGSTSAVLIIVVIGLGLVVWVALVVLKKFLPGGKGLFSTPAMEVLGRTQFEQQKYMALVRVGKRVLVIGVAPGGFDALGEITDDEEVADLMAIAKPKTSTGKDIFHKMFQRQIEGEQPVAPERGTDVSESKDGGAIADIQARVRSLREVE